MILYHGTTKEKAKLIDTCKAIRTTTKETTHYPSEGSMKTECGYVYLTNSLKEAFGFSTNNILKGGNIEVFVYEVHINDEEVEIDNYELEIKGMEKNLPYKGFYRAGRNMLFSSDVKKKLVLNFKDWDEYVITADYTNLGEKYSNDWIEIN